MVDIDGKMKLRDDNGEAERHIEIEKLRNRRDAIEVELQIENRLLDNIELKKMMNHERMEIGAIYPFLGLAGLLFLIANVLRINSSVTGYLMVSIFILDITMWVQAIRCFFKPLYVEYLWKKEKNGKKVEKSNLEKEAQIHIKEIDKLNLEINKINELIKAKEIS